MLDDSNLGVLPVGGRNESREYNNRLKEVQK